MHLKITIQYDGTNFAGSQLQAEGRGRTVQGELEKALAQLAEEPVRVVLAGRTDAGVHAWGQAASLDFPQREQLDTPHAIGAALNGILSSVPDLAVTSAQEVPAGFHARFAARKRAYRYLLWNGEAPAPLLARFSLRVPQRLQIPAMSEAAALLVGSRDLAAFAGRGMGVPDEAADDEAAKPSTIRTVYLARLAALDSQANFWQWDAPEAPKDPTAGKLLVIDLVANSFLPQMIRTIVGTLLEVGQRKRTVQEFETLIASRDRRLAGPTAKPHGLCLLWVEY